MKLHFLEDYNTADGIIEKGEVENVAEKRAKNLIKRGIAERVEKERRNVSLSTKQIREHYLQEEVKDILLEVTELNNYRQAMITGFAGWYKYRNENGETEMALKPFKKDAYSKQIKERVDEETRSLYWSTELKKIERRISEPEERIDEVREEEKTDIIAELENFCSFVEENGFKAFWDRGYTSGEIRRRPEEIGRCQLMAYLASLRGYSAREVPSGSGFQDIVYIEETLVPTIIEVKVLQSRNSTRYDEGIEQLQNYTDGQNTETAYYVIFQKGDLYQDVEFEENGLKIIQRCVDIKPEAPTS